MIIHPRTRHPACLRRARAKDHPGIAYGEVATNSAIVCSLYFMRMRLSATLSSVQNELFNIGAELASESGTEKAAAHARAFTSADAKTASLEHLMDDLDAALPPLTTFILPSGSQAGTLLHLCRTVCRRAERAVVTLSHLEQVNPDLARYLNRLSDLLFVMARHANHADGKPETNAQRVTSAPRPQTFETYNRLNEYSFTGNTARAEKSKLPNKFKGAGHLESEHDHGYRAHHLSRTSRRRCNAGHYAAPASPGRVCWPGEAEGQPPDRCPGRPQARRAARPPALLWAARLGKTTWRTSLPPEGVLRAGYFRAGYRAGGDLAAILTACMSRYPVHRRGAPVATDGGGGLSQRWRTSG